MMTELEKYNNVMKHFQDVYGETKESQSMSGYETNIANHYEDDPDDWEGSMVFRHWNEDDNEDDNSDDWEGSLVFKHWNKD